MIRWLPLLLALAGPVAAQDVTQSAQEARARLEQAAQDLVAAGDARDRVAALTGTVHAYEDGLIALREGLRRVAQREQTLTLSLDAKSAEVAELLGVLQTMGRAPAPLLLLHPSGPLGTARGGMMLSDITPALQAEADTLAAEIDELTRLRALQQDAAQVLQDGLDGAQTARTALSEAIDQRAPLPRRFTEDPVQAALLEASSDTLDTLADALATMDTGPALTDAATLKGELLPPASGPVLRGYNRADAAGVRRPGVVIATRPRALVTLPAAMTLRFRGTLDGYGTVVILEPAADVLIVVAGLAEAFGQPGEILPAGSPLGLMGGNPAPAGTELNANTGAAMSESLYIEVREGGRPVDPAIWFVLEG